MCVGASHAIHEAFTNFSYANPSIRVVVTKQRCLRYAIESPSLEHAAIG
jgi:hypothetical protein